MGWNLHNSPCIPHVGSPFQLPNSTKRCLKQTQTTHLFIDRLTLYFDKYKIEKYHNANIAVALFVTEFGGVQYELGCSPRQPVSLLTVLQSTLNYIPATAFA